MKPRASSRSAYVRLLAGRWRTNVQHCVPEMQRHAVLQVAALNKNFVVYKIQVLL